MVSLAVMAHPKRRAFVDELLPQLPGAQVIWDRYGDRWDTGRRSLLAFDPAATHHCVVQDDAVLCRDFIAALQVVVAGAGDHPVGLYVGRVRPHQHTITPAVRNALRTRTPWIAGPGPFWGVGLILPTSHIPDIVRWGDLHPQIANYDRRIQVFYSERGIDCRYTVPSLVDHRPVTQNPSLIAGRDGNRQAHEFCGQRSPLELDWTRDPFPIPGGRMTTKATHTLLTTSTFRPIAARDLIGYDFVGVRRRVRAGKRVPIGLRVDPADLAGEIAARASAPPAEAPAPPAAAPAAPEPPAPTPAPAPDSVGVSPGMRSPSWSSSDSAAKLAAEAERRGLTVAGTGKNGKPLKSDLVAALAADDNT